MQRTVGAVLLIAGTCIGSGMIALPMMMAKLGLVPSVLLMFIMWVVVYYTSLMSVELNLQAGRGLSLGGLGQLFSGKIAQVIGIGSIKILSYALLAVYLYGEASVFQKLILNYNHVNLDLKLAITACAILSMTLLLTPIKVLDYVNRVLFIGLIITILVLVAGLASLMNWNELPLFRDNWYKLSSFQVLLPVIFTSFGFQVIFHTLTNYLNKDKQALKKAFLWGSLLPAIVYIIWTSGVLSVIFNKSPDFYEQMALGNADVGDLIQELSSIASWTAIQKLVWWISLLAIFTSIIGVSVGLFDSIKSVLSKAFPHHQIASIFAAILTILPGYLVALIVPKAFISVLGFAGMILVIIAIFLPAYLLFKIRGATFNYPVLRNKIWMTASILVGATIFIFEILNII